MMVQDTARDPRESARTLFEAEKIERPTIKILLYTDAPEIVTEEPFGAFGLGRMINHLKGHAPVFAQFEVRYESRYINNSDVANNMLDRLLDREKTTGHQFDQIWFFGVHQINRAGRSLSLRGGTPESELTSEESRALQRWMDEDQGGVLVTGDHANERPIDAFETDANEHIPDPPAARNEPFLGLGRALGRAIPRAGKLRVWEGDPTAHPGHTFNTHFNRRGIGSTSPILEHDSFPQQIVSTLFDDLGRPSDRGTQRHPLFFYRDDQPIEFFPDHFHEGAVVIPDLSDETIWIRNAEGFKPVPQVVATGTDGDTGAELRLIVAYDGTAVNRGRIVADSSWHHYFNVNLEGLLFPAPVGSAADQIGQFYANLAIWLCPTQKRQQMANVMEQWIVNHPLVLEGFGSFSTEQLAVLIGSGGAALNLLKRVASPCEIHELLQVKVPKKRRDLVETLHLPEENLLTSALPSKQLLLGYLVNGAPQKANGNSEIAATNDESLETTLAERAEDITAAEQAFRRQQSEILGALKAAEEFFANDD